MHKFVKKVVKKMMLLISFGFTVSISFVGLNKDQSGQTGINICHTELNKVLQV